MDYIINLIKNLLINVMPRRRPFVLFLNAIIDKLCNLEHLCFYEIRDLRWSKRYDSRHLKPTNT